jgi:hypothetical protein
VFLIDDDVEDRADDGDSEIELEERVAGSYPPEKHDR